MKKILIVTSGLTHGGVNKALLNLLKCLDHSIYKIDIFSIYQSGPYRKMFEDYSLISMNGIVPKYLHYDFSAENNAQTDFYIKLRMHLTPKSFCKKVGNTLTKNNYDIVISFQEGFTTYLATFVRAEKHIAWIHCDYSRYLQNKKKSEKLTYEKYDHIVAVSKYTAESVKKCIPSISDKVVAVYNVMDSEGILSLSNEKNDDNRFVLSEFTLLSIGRMDPVKRFSYIPAIAHELKNRDIPFRWYIIGDGGSEKKKVIQEIEKHDVKNEVILLGTKNNPYSYLKQAQVFVCTSISEAYPNVINEAKILHIPIVSADFPTATELIENGVNGYICPIREIPEMLEKLYFDKELYEKLSDNIKNYKYENQTIIQQIYTMFG